MCSSIGYTMHSHPSQLSPRPGCCGVEVRYIRSVVHRITLQTFGAPYGEYRFVYTMHSHPLKHLLFNVSQPTPSTSPNRLHSMSARLTLTVVVAGRRSSCPARAWTWPGCLCPSRRRRPHTRRLPAVRETPRSAEMFNVQAAAACAHCGCLSCPRLHLPPP